MLDDLFLYAVYLHVSFWIVNMAMLRIKATEVFNICACICSVVLLLFIFFLINLYLIGLNNN